MIGYWLRQRSIRFLALVGLAVAAGLVAAPAAAQVRVTQTAALREAVCVDANGYLISMAIGDCSDDEVTSRFTEITVGPAGSTTSISGEDGSATFNSSATFNGGVQFNGQVGFSGYTTMNQLNSNTIINSGALTTNSINTGSLNATGNGRVNGSLTSGSLSTGSALITNLQVALGTVLNTSTTISGRLTISGGTTVDAGGNRIQNVGAPIAGTDAANKNYVDAALTGVQGNVTNLTNQVAGQETRITAVEAVNTVQDTRLTTVETENSVQNTRLSSVETVNAGQDARMTAIESVNTAQSNQISTLQNQVGGLQTSVNGLRQNIKQANGGIAAAVALGGTMIVPDSTVSMSFNLATYRGEQGFSGSLVGRISPKVYINAGVAASTVRGSTTGRVGISFGL